MKNFIKVAKLALILIFISNYSFSNDEIEDIKEVRHFISEVGKSIISVAKDKNRSEDQKRQDIINIVDQSIDSDWISRFVLGINYRTASTEQIAKFTELYRKFMINTYGPKFKDYNGKSFVVTSVEPQRRLYLAKAEFLPADSNEPILVDFRVKKNKDRLYILDFITEGISLIETQRTEFNSAISNLGMDGFLNNMENKVNDLTS